MKPYSPDELKSLFGSCNSWERLLTILGITFDSTKGGKMIYPEDDKKDVILSCCGLAAALHGIIIIYCNYVDFSNAIIFGLKNTVYGTQYTDIR